jgi:hypothetical protein
MLRFLYLIITAVVRMAIMGLVMYLVGKGDLELKDVAPYINEAISAISVALTAGVLIGWVIAEKWFHGLVPNSPYRRPSLPGQSPKPQPKNKI